MHLQILIWLVLYPTVAFLVTAERAEWWYTVTDGSEWVAGALWPIVLIYGLYQLAEEWFRNNDL